MYKHKQWLYLFIGTVITLFLFQNCGRDPFQAIDGVTTQSSLSNENHEPPVTENPPAEEDPLPLEPDVRAVKWSEVTGRSDVAVSTNGLVATKDDGVGESNRSIYANFVPTKGRWYFEVRVLDIIAGDRQRIGVASTQGRVPDATPTASVSYGLDFNGSFSLVENDDYLNVPLAAALKVGDVVGVALDREADQVTFFINGQKIHEHPLLAGHDYAPFFYGSKNSNGSVIANFGTAPFLYSPGESFQAPDNTGLLIPAVKGFSAALSASQFITISADRLTAVKDDGNSAAGASAYVDLVPGNGKWYFEGTAGALISGDRQRLGIATTTGRVPLNGATGDASYGYDFNGSVSQHQDGQYLNVPGLATISAGKVIGVAVDMTALKVRFYVNGVFQKEHAIKAGYQYAPFFTGSNNSNGSVTVNLGAKPFKYAAPVGHRPALFN